MSAALARQAMAHLAPLLRSRGTSPELGKLIRRSVQYLDGAVAAIDENGRHAALANALVALMRARTFVASSSSEADAQQGRGIAQALELLQVIPVAPAPSEPPIPSPSTDTSRAEKRSPPTLNLVRRRADIAVDASPTQESRGSSGTGAPPTVFPRPGPSSSARLASTADPLPRTVSSPKRDGLAATLLSRISTLYERRVRLLADVSITNGDLARVDDRLLRAIHAAAWTQEAQGEEDAEVTEFARVAVAVARTAVRDKGPLHGFLDACVLETAVDAVRFVPRGRVSRVLDRLSMSVGSTRSGAIAARVAAEHGRPTPESVVAELLTESFDIATIAAGVLDSMGEQQRGLVEAARERLERDAATPGADEFACVLAWTTGDERLLGYARALVADGRPSLPAISALAAFGDEGDAELLARAASADGPFADFAALACGHLGFSTAVVTLIDQASDAMADKLSSLVFGSSGRPAKAVGRLLHGAPRSLDHLRELGAVDDEWVFLSAWRSRELRMHDRTVAFAACEPRAPDYLRRRRPISTAGRPNPDSADGPAEL